jgi:hypothetical protein
MITIGQVVRVIAPTQAYQTYYHKGVGDFVIEQIDNDTRFTPWAKLIPVDGCPACRARGVYVDARALELAPEPEPEPDP